MRLSLCETPTREKRSDYNTGNFVPYQVTSSKYLVVVGLSVSPSVRSSVRQSVGLPVGLSVGWSFSQSIVYLLK